MQECLLLAIFMSLDMSFMRPVNSPTSHLFPCGFPYADDPRSVEPVMMIIGDYEPHIEALFAGMEASLSCQNPINCKDMDN